VRELRRKQIRENNYDEKLSEFLDLLMKIYVNIYTHSPSA
jgi:hypothetical protein